MRRVGTALLTRRCRASARRTNGPARRRIAGLELLIGYTRLGNLLALLDREGVAEIQKHLFGTVCLTPRYRSGPPLRAFFDASRRSGMGGTSLKLVR